VEGKHKLLAPSEILFVNMQVAKKNIGNNLKKGIGIIPKFLDMLRTMKVLLTKLQMRKQKRKQGRFAIWHNLAFVAPRMSHARV